MSATPPPSRAALWLLVASGVLVALGWVTASWRAGQVNTLLRERILLQADKVAKNIPLADARELTFTEADADSAAFRRIRRSLEAYAAAAGIRSLYTMALRPDGQIVFGPENLATDDPLASPPGTVYQDAEPQDYLALREGVPAVFGPFTDEYGTFVGALAPLFNPRTGDVLLVVGLDIEGAQWVRMLNQAKRAAWIATALLLVLLWAIGVWAWLRRSRGQRVPVGAAVTGMGLAVSFVAGYFVFAAAYLREQAARSNACLGVYTIVEHALSRTVDELTLLSDAVEDPLKLTQERFSSASKVLAHGEAIQAVTWAPKVTEIQGHFFELNQHGQRTPVGVRSDYYPALLINPFEENRDRLGFDIGSDPLRRDAIERSLLSGLPESTAAISFVNDPPERKSLALYLARKDEAQSPIGIFGTGIRVTDLWSKLLRRQRDAFAEFPGALIDVTQPGNPQILAAMGPTRSFRMESSHLNDFSHLTLPIFFGGRVFCMAFDFEGLPASPRLWQEALSLTGALSALSILAGILLGNQKRRQEELEKAVSERTAALRASNQELSRLAEEARSLAEEARQADRAKSAFLATMSHEIRTPLNGVLGFAQLLARTPLTAEQTEFVHNISASSESLLALLSDVLDYSKIEAGRLELETVPFSLHRLATDAIAAVRLPAQQKSLELALHIPSDLPDRRSGDPHRLRQILLNFLSNAVKFTPDGGRVDLHIGHGEHPDRVRFEVSDTGIGIPPEKHAQLFRPFSQADSSNTREFGGSGLGLAICRRITECMGGTIGFRTTPGEGSVFHVEIPLPGACEMPEPQSEKLPAPLPVKEASPTTASGRASLAGLRILIAEDNAVNQKLLLMQMHRLGILPTLTADGRAALSAFEQAPYDVVLLDCQMPEMDGPEVAAQIRLWEKSHPEKRPAILIALTADAQTESRRRALTHGMDYYLTKPLRLTDLEEILHKVAAARQPAPSAT